MKSRPDTFSEKSKAHTQEAEKPRTVLDSPGKPDQLNFCQSNSQYSIELQPQ